MARETVIVRETYIYIKVASRDKLHRSESSCPRRAGARVTLSVKGNREVANPEVLRRAGRIELQKKQVSLLVYLTFYRCFYLRWQSLMHIKHYT